GDSSSDMDEMLRRARLHDQRRSVACPALPRSVPGLYVRPVEGGFVTHLIASKSSVHAVRRLTARVLVAQSLRAAVVEDVQLVVSELIGNAVRACGDAVPLVVEVRAVPGYVVVAVHDPAGDRLPHRRHAAVDGESGRGLALLDVLAPGWAVVPTPVGKQIRCQVADTEERNCR
ncbi:ATP-binding protein, partial [Streptomyces mirabilis]|uniref:ATP-binding protein n=1 Tax=Streptomyces mirabilis TaxID=68239 RepID=UPI0036CEC784